MKQFLNNHTGGVTESNSLNVIHFEEYTKWMNEYPVDIWHDASEEPQGDNWEILCVDDFDLFWVESKANALWKHNNWEEYSEVECVKMWAYIRDLLSEGSESEIIRR